MGSVKVAVNSAKRLIPQRYDWCGTSADFILKPNSIILTADSYLQLKQMMQELCYLLRRELVSLAFFATKQARRQNGVYTARLVIERGITREWANYLIGEIKALPIPSKCTYSNQEILINTDHIDDAQQIIAQLRVRKLNLPIHFRNLQE